MTSTGCVESKVFSQNGTDFAFSYFWEVNVTQFFECIAKLVEWKCISWCYIKTRSAMCCCKLKLLIQIFAGCNCHLNRNFWKWHIMLCVRILKRSGSLIFEWKSVILSSMKVNWLTGSMGAYVSKAFLPFTKDSGISYNCLNQSFGVECRWFTLKFWLELFKLARWFWFWFLFAKDCP